MANVSTTDIFDKWLDGLKDRRANARILVHIGRMEEGNMGDVESVGDGVFEKKIDCGPGYRLYYCWQGEQLVLLLCGGDKSTQQNDINQAIEIRKGLV